MQIQEIDQVQIDEIISHFEPIDDWKEIGPFCVDGRDGPCDMSGGKNAKKHLFVQALGRSLLIGVIGFIASDHAKPFNEFTKNTINQLSESKFGSGVHRGNRFIFNRYRYQDAQKKSISTETLGTKMAAVSLQHSP